MLQLDISYADAQRLVASPRLREQMARRLFPDASADEINVVAQDFQRGAEAFISAARGEVQHPEVAQMVGTLRQQRNQAGAPQSGSSGASGEASTSASGGSNAAGRSADGGRVGPASNVQRLFEQYGPGLGINSVAEYQQRANALLQARGPGILRRTQGDITRVANPLTGELVATQGGQLLTYQRFSPGMSGLGNFSPPVA